jgi:bifunctional aspartokinase / homoserine dehydrogenase 1
MPFIVAFHHNIFTSGQTNTAPSARTFGIAMRTLTMKFGGSSVSTTSALTQVVSIVLQECERWERLIVVVSALEGVTDALLEAIHLAKLSNRRGYRRIVATIRTRHMALIDQLPLDTNERSALQADIDRLLFDMLDTCQAIADSIVDNVTPDTTDAIIGVGERMASRIIAALLRQNGLRGVAIDTTDIIITDTTFRNARPDMERTSARIQQHLLPMLDRQIVPVITGFIAGTSAGKPTTLGRGGSDYTASILGVCTGSNEVWMWTNVDGMMSTDPRESQDARVIPELSYDEVAELAYFGARILHARMIGPLRTGNIPLRIKNTFKPQQPGTLIHNRAAAHDRPTIKAVTAIQGISLTAFRSGPLTDIANLTNGVFMETIGTQADVTISAQSSSESFICFVVPTSAGPDAIHTIHAALEERLRETPVTAIWDVAQVGIITAIGAELNTQPRVTARILNALDDIRVLALSQGPAHCNLSVVVASQESDEALRRIHQLAIGDNQ